MCVRETDRERVSECVCERKIERVSECVCEIDREGEGWVGAKDTYMNILIFN